jgi:uncharacterized protein (TIGR00375 family)
MDIPTISHYAKRKGIKLVGTGDFTHPLWLNELKKTLKEVKYGMFEYDGVNFILTGEVSNIFSYNGKIRKVHNIIFSPDFKTCEQIQKCLSKYGDIASDGRPTLSFSCRDLVKSVMDISSDCFIIPAHAWTPWFSVFGSQSGFDSLEECFQDMTKYIFSIETGLSSDPEMNWRLSRLDSITLTSNSDAHSPEKIAREANVFDCEIDYKEIKEVIKNKDKTKFLYTIEFFPEEGKYHFDGHRNCNVRFSPEETKKNKGICPKCGKKVTVGVMNRVDSLADRDYGYIPPNAIPYKKIIPLKEIIALSTGYGVDSEFCENEYKKMIQKGENELNILLNLSFEELTKIAPYNIAIAIKNMREGKVKILPGYDGMYGEIKISLDEKDTQSQLSLF